LIKAVELIKGTPKGVLHLSMDQTKGAEELKKEIAAAIKKLDQGQGVLILTDLFGGTPSNISLSFNGSTMGEATNPWAYAEKSSFSIQEREAGGECGSPH